jgi:transposase
MTRTALLTDEMWARVEPLLPDRSPRRGGRWSHHRPVVEAICWRFRTGSPWRDLPSDFPAWQTVWWRFDRWAKDGTWDRVLRELQGQAHAVAELEWTVSVDSTVARAHQHAAGARKSRTGGRIESQDPAA